MEVSTEKPLNDSKTHNSVPITLDQSTIQEENVHLTTKRLVEILVSGTLKDKVCRSCLKVSPLLTSLAQELEVANDGALYKVSVQDMIQSFYPYMIKDDSELPRKICKKCLDRTINLYLFNLQYKQSEQALLHCLNEVYDSVTLLDPLDRPKLGRQKIHVNHNVVNVTYKYVKQYAQPLIQLTKKGELLDETTKALNKYECPKCWEVLPSLSSFLNHKKTHPKNMWLKCRFCGLSFSRKIAYRHHIRDHENNVLPQNTKSEAQPNNTETVTVNDKFECKSCTTVSQNYIAHLQHMETHKFKTVLDNLLHKSAKELCTVCLDSKKDMVNVDKTVALHGGCEELMGDRSVDNILAAAFPDMPAKSFFGNKICQQCLDSAINAYIFTRKSYNIRRRLDLCITKALDKLEDIKPDKNIIIEVDKDLIMPVKELDLIRDGINSFIEEQDENKLHVEVLEDKYRTEEDETKIEVKEVKKPEINAKINGIAFVEKTMDVSEFLTFKTKKVKKRLVKFTCPMCNKHFVSDYFLKKHCLRHKHRKASCQSCNKLFGNIFSMKEHERMTHILNRSYISCKICFRAFDCKYKLEKHMQCHRKKLCQLCDKVFKSQRFYDIHLQRHAIKFKTIRANLKKLNCSFCERKFLNRNSVDIHVNKAHFQMQPYSCDMCEAKFYTKTNLNNHKKVHRIYSKEKCEFCDKILFSRKSLVIHVRKHMNMKPFQCHVCVQTFFSEYKRNKHMKIFHGGSFVCKLCKKTFAGRSDLKTHIEKSHVLSF